MDQVTDASNTKQQFLPLSELNLADLDDVPLSLREHPVP